MRLRLLHVAGLACLAAGPTLSEGFGASTGQDRVHGEMIETLEAYADYKMGRFDAAFIKWRTLAEKGNAQGILNTANMLAAGRGTRQDIQAAVAWYQEGAETGDPLSALALAKLWQSSPDIAPDADAAARMMRRAAELGSAEATGVLAREGSAGEGAEVAATRSPCDAEPGSSPAADCSDGTRSTTSGEATQPTLAPGDRRSVRRVLDTMAAAANARDSDWLLSFLAPDARLRLRLQHQNEATEVTEAELSDLWEKSFAEAERYSFSRRDVSMRSEPFGARVTSRIEETFAGPDSGTRHLLLTESLHISLDDDRPRIIDMLLSVEGAPASDGAEVAR